MIESYINTFAKRIQKGSDESSTLMTDDGGGRFGTAVENMKWT